MTAFKITNFQNIHCELVGLTRLSWLPTLSLLSWCCVAAICAIVWLILRAGWGRSVVNRRIGLTLLRTAALALAVLILMGPSIVDEQPGETTRPTLFYLLDGSQSMQLGGQSTRWHDSLRFIHDAEKVSGPNASEDCRAFRFGHRLTPLQTQSPTATDVRSTITLTKSSGLASTNIAPPDATDSRLADALRQLSTLVDPASSAGVVLLSDGRVRATESVERLAEHFGKTGVPIHVVPVGETSGSGDVAIVSLVADPRVRKFTENEMTVFIRSFGFNGQRTVARILSRNRLAGSDSVQLAEMPITLVGGPQSVVLTYRVEDRAEELSVVVDALPGELTDRNNRVQTSVEIDRTKLRVLYVEGDASLQSSLINSISAVVRSGSSATPAPTAIATNIRDALEADEDLECSVVVRFGVGRLRMLTGSYAGAGFPMTRAELFSFDCIVFSNLGPGDLELEPRQLGYLTSWIEGRGGGLIVTGRQAFDSMSWEYAPLAALLPIKLNGLTNPPAENVSVTATDAKHPIWRLRWEESSNAQLLSALPALPLSISGAVAKPLAEVLATTGRPRVNQPSLAVAAQSPEQSQPVLIAHRAGRGRVITSTVDLAGNAFTQLAESWGPQSERVAGKLWRNLIYWATEGSSVGRRRLVASSDKRFYRPGDKLSISAMAFDESAKRSQKYNVWAMFEPVSLDNSSLYAPVLWPENMVRVSGETGPRIAWGEELSLKPDATSEQFSLDLALSESTGLGDSGLRIELTAYEGAGSSAADHGTQVDSTSLAIQILSDPFEQQNPLPNHELLVRLAQLSGGQVLHRPDELAQILKNRPETVSPPKLDTAPAWSRWWLWLTMIGILTTEWLWRRTTGLA